MSLSLGTHLGPRFPRAMKEATHSSQGHRGLGGHQARADVERDHGNRPIRSERARCPGERIRQEEREALPAEDRAARGTRASAVQHLARIVLADRRRTGGPGRLLTPSGSFERLMTDHPTLYRMHLTPRGWERGSRPSDTLESWEITTAPSLASNPAKPRARRVAEARSLSWRELEELKLARIHHGAAPRV